MMLRLLGVALTIVVLSRIIFDGLNFVPAAICIQNARTIETCKEKNLLPQKISNQVNIIGAYLEACTSFSLLLILLMWKRFNGLKFLIAITKVGHFWLWFALCSSEIITVLQVDLTEAQSNGKPDDLGFGIIFESVFLTLFASALNFVGRDTIRYHFQLKYANSKWSHFFIFVYFGVLVSYFVRNFGLFLYNTALLTMSISQVSSHSKPHNRQWDSVLLVFSCAFRGCFFKFFFSKIFQGCNPPQVCDNINIIEPFPDQLDNPGLVLEPPAENEGENLLGNID